MKMIKKQAQPQQSATANIIINIWVCLSLHSFVFTSLIFLSPRSLPTPHLFTPLSLPCSTQMLLDEHYALPHECLSSSQCLHWIPSLTHSHSYLSTISLIQYLISTPTSIAATSIITFFSSAIFHMLEAVYESCHWDEQRPLSSLLKYEHCQKSSTFYALNMLLLQMVIEKFLYSNAKVPLQFFEITQFVRIIHQGYHLFFDAYCQQHCIVYSQCYLIFSQAQRPDQMQRQFVFYWAQEYAYLLQNYNLQGQLLQAQTFLLRLNCQMHTYQLHLFAYLPIFLYFIIITVLKHILFKFVCQMMIKSQCNLYQLLLETSIIMHLFLIFAI